MKMPKFVRKWVLTMVGLEAPIHIRGDNPPIPREAFMGFTEKEIDEIVIGKTYKNIMSLQDYLFECVELAHSDPVQRNALKKRISRGIDITIHAEARYRSL